MYKCNTLYYHLHLHPTCNGVYITQTEQLLLGLHYNMECNTIEFMHKIQSRVMHVKGILRMEKRPVGVQGDILYFRMQISLVKLRPIYPTCISHKRILTAVPLYLP